MKRLVKTMTAVCPSCHTNIHFSKRPRLRDPVVCHECEESLKIVCRTPLKLEWSFWGEVGNWPGARFDGYDSYDRGWYDPYDWD